jgi:hypothetical protein
MSYLMTLVAFALALGGGLFVFLETLPESQFLVLKRSKWSREASIVFILATAMAFGFLTFRALQ